MRIKEVDNAKGIGILLVMLGHCITNMDNSLNTIILSFHMPLFFFLSGMVLKKEQTVLELIKKRTIVLGSSLMTGFILSDIVKVFCDVCWLKSIQIRDFNWFSALDNWFFFVLFISSIISLLLIKFGRVCSLLGCAVSSVTFLLFYSDNVFILKYFEQCFLAIPFVLIGYIWGAKLLYIVKNDTCLNRTFFLCVFLIEVIVAWYNGPCAMAANIYNKKLLFMLSSFLGVVSILEVSSIINSSLLQFLGKNSIVIFVTHFSVQKIIVSFFMFRGFYDFSNYPFYFITFMILLIFEILIVIFIRKYVPFLFGMKQEGKKCHYLQEKH